MALKIKTGLTAPNGFIDDVFELDKQVYPAALCGKKENLQSRFEKNNDTFILAYDGDRLVGYINLFPISQKLDNELCSKSNDRMRDDDITPQEVAVWQTEKENNVFIISVVISPDYRNGEAIILLGNGLLSFLREKEAKGYKIASISGSAVSNGGEKFLKRFRARLVKPLEHGYKYYRTDKNNIRDLIEDGLLL